MAARAAPSRSSPRSAPRRGQRPSSPHAVPTALNDANVKTRPMSDADGPPTPAGPLKRARTSAKPRHPTDADAFPPVAVVPPPAAVTSASAATTTAPKKPLHTYVALLYSITTTAGVRLKNSELEAIATALGHHRPRTYASTGNLVFQSEIADLGAVEAALEAAYAARFRHVDIIVRTAQQWAELCGACPFVGLSAQDGSKTMVRVMRAPLSQALYDSELKPHEGSDTLALVGGDVWLKCAVNAMASRVYPRMAKPKLGVGTMRNWNTVTALQSILTEEYSDAQE